MTRLLFNILIMIAYLMLAAGGTIAADKEAKPILRIETGRHTASITSLDSDTQGRYFVTSSTDKTVRVWDAESGRMIKTLRPHVGDTPDEGIVYSVAISPDGSAIACLYQGMPITLEGNNNEDGTPKLFRHFYLTVFENNTWNRREVGSAFEPSQLKFSPDGKYLAKFSRSSVEVYNTNNWSLQAMPKDKIGGVLADISNNLIMVLNKNNELSLYKILDKKIPEKINIYDALLAAEDNIKVILNQKLPYKDMEPYSLRLSPDGKRFAIGYERGKRVIVGSVAKNQDYQELDTHGVEDFNFSSKASFSSVAWSKDSKYLYAGGIATKGEYPEPTVIRRWDITKKKLNYMDISSGIRQPIRAIVPRENKGAVFATDLSIGIIDRNKTRLLSPFLAHENPSSVSMDNNGNTIGFYYQTTSGSVLGDRYTFDIKSRSLSPVPVEKTETGLYGSHFDADTPGMMLITPYTGDTPTLNGVKLNINGHIRSSAIAKLGDSCVVGTSHWELIRYDRNANVIWSNLMPEMAVGLNISRDGRIVVTSMVDGTFRWYSHATGEELLAFFPSNDRKRWVLWTPSGYYDASPQGDELIGWYLQGSGGAPGNFYPASRFKSLYYRPDIISKVLETLSESKAILAANKDSGRKQEQSPDVATLLPPSVSIISPSSGSSFTSGNVSVRYKVSSPSGEPVTNVKIMLNGRPVASNRGIKVIGKEATEQTVSVNLPSKDCEIGIIAENRYSSSEPAAIQLKWVGKKIDEFVIKPKMYMLAIGVSDYRQSDLKLKYAAKDAQDFAKVMNGQKGGLYRDVVSRVLLNGAATKDSILDGFEWVQKETTSNDVAVIFLAGHGVNDSNGTYYFLPENAEPDKLKRTGVSLADLKQTVSSLPGKVLLFVDTCHSGNIFGGRRTAVDINAIVNDLSSAENGAVVFASSTGRQYSIEKDEWANGAFTKALIEGLNGGADYTKKGSITVNMLDLFVSERVKELSGGKQTPATAKPISVPDFPLAIRPQ